MWNLLSCNKPHQRFLKDKEDMRLRRNLEHSRAIVSATPPSPHKHVDLNYKGKLADLGNF